MLTIHLISPVYLETVFAWYILKTPSPQYQPYFRQFYAPRWVAQMVISSAFTHPEESYETFLNNFLLKVDAFGRTHQEDDLWEAVSHILPGVSFR